ncbi:MAG: acyl-CoA synthetase [Corynebacterium sp.]|nr:long-chain fatty acid--CoA ligase [Corynebacterium sp.]
MGDRLDRGFGNWVTLHSKRYPESVAYIDGETGSVRTYAQLEERTNALADVLAKRGTARGDRVALVTMNSIETMEILVAVAKLGAIAVPINYRLTSKEIEFILLDSGASSLFFSMPFLDLVNDACTDETRVRDRFVVPDSEMRLTGKSSDLEAMITRGSSERVVREVNEADICVVMYTSGTTGKPKGAMLSHGNFVWNAVHSLGLGDGWTAGDRTISAAPLFHIGALGVNTLPFLFIGGSCVVLENFVPANWISSVEKYGVTNAFLVPVMWSAVLGDASFGAGQVRSLRFAVSGGAPCPVAVIEAMRELGVPFTEGLGMTETSPLCAVLRQDEGLRKKGTVGKPVQQVEFRIEDDAGEDVGVGRVGELLVRGPNVFSGYWNNPKATSEALRDGWFHTGDLAKVDEEGFYTLVDRKKDMVITGGENVYSTEVESVVRGHPDVRDVAVIGIPDEKWGEAVTAVVVRAEGSSLTPEELIAWSRRSLAGFKVPKSVEYVDVLPRNATGKVLKRTLRAERTGSEMSVRR